MIPKQLVWEAYQRVKANHGAAGVDGESLTMFEQDLKGHLTSTPYQTRTFPDPRARERWEFTGAVAAEAIRRKYLGKSVADHLKRGNRHPVLYVNVD